MDQHLSTKARLQAAVQALPETISLEDAEALLRAHFATRFSTAHALGPIPSALPIPEADTTVTIRPVRTTDAPALAQLIGELGYPMDVPLAAQKLGELSASPLDAVWVAEMQPDARVAGVVCTHRTWVLHRRNPLGRITALAVSEAHRRFGIGRLLMQVAETHLWGSGCDRIELTSGTHRDAAHHFYRSLGYAVQSTRFMKSSPEVSP